MKPLLKNTKENYNREEKQEEDNLLEFLKFKYICQSARIYFIQKILTQVTVGENEGIESALRRFKRQVSKSGIFADLKRLRHHETPIEKYKRKLQQRRKARRR